MAESDVERELRKAQTTLREAESLLEGGFCDGAANRLYYAAFHAARASVWKVKPDARLKSHKGVRALYAREVVRQGKAPAEFSTLLGRLDTDRGQADYGGGGVPCSAVEGRMEQVRMMVSHARGLQRRRASAQGAK